MKTSSKLAILLSALLVMSIVAGTQLAFPQSSGKKDGFSKEKDESLREMLRSLKKTEKVSVTPDGKPNAAPITEQEAKNQSITPKGAAGSGWKPDAQVAGSNYDEINPSIGTYIDRTTGAVTLYAVAQVWYGDWVPARWAWRLYRSDDQGATWYWIYHGWWDGARSYVEPSLAVSPYNGTVFIAIQVTNPNDIWVYKIVYPNWWSYAIDADADDDRSPQLVSEYAYGDGNYLYVSYEMRWTDDDRDLYFGRSTDWGKTWWADVALRGGAAGPDLDDVFVQSSITYAQGDIYIAYRHSEDYGTTGHIDVSYSKTYGSSWIHAENVSAISNDASWPSVAGSRIGDWHKPATVIVAYQFTISANNHDVLYTWSTDYGGHWTGGDAWYSRIAASNYDEWRPKLAVDGIGTEDTNVGGSFHLVYRRTDETVWGHLCYTQLFYWDVPLLFGPLPWFQYLGWSSPVGLINDDGAMPSFLYDQPAITVYTRTVGGEKLWEPGVVWSDLRNYYTAYDDIYYSTPGTDFSITFVPSSQSVVAGKSIAYYVTVNRLAGPAAPAYLGGTPHYPIYRSVYVSDLSYSVSPVTPTATSTLTLYTSNLAPPGDWQLAATATIGGYRRMVIIPYTITAPPTLTLNINPTIVAPNGKVTLSGQLSPSPGAPTQIFLYYRFPHQTGSWVLAATVLTDAAGAYSVEYPPTSPQKVSTNLKTGQYDFVAVWLDPTTGSYATSPIKVLTVA